MYSKIMFFGVGDVLVYFGNNAIKNWKTKVWSIEIKGSSAEFMGTV